MVSIDTVYQRVLALANKEQRGYIPPVKFNLFANQAQMDIFEQYFHDLKLFKRAPGGSADTHADSVDIIREKINVFHFYARNFNFSLALNDSGLPNDFGDYDLTDAFNDYIYRITEVSVDYSPNDTEELIDPLSTTRVRATEVEAEDFIMHANSLILKPSKTHPVWYRYTGEGSENNNRHLIKVTPYPTKRGTNELPLPNLFVSYIKKPSTVQWNGINANGNLVYSGNGTDFELHPSEETKLVVKILQLAAIAMKDPGLLAIASREDIKNIQQEKQ